MMSKKYFGRQSEYTISFTKEDDGCWYVDYPDWPFDHHNLMMVEGADDLCGFFLTMGRIQKSRYV